MILKQNPLAIKPGDIVHRERPLTDPPTERSFSKEQMNRVMDSSKRHYMALREIIELTKYEDTHNFIEILDNIKNTAIKAIIN